MKVRFTLRTTDNQTHTGTTTRSELADVFSRYKDDIRWLRAEICLTSWIYDSDFGWFRRTRFRYVPGRPDLWQVTVDDFKPSAYGPF